MRQLQNESCALLIPVLLFVDVCCPLILMQRFHGMCTRFGESVCVFPSSHRLSKHLSGEILAAFRETFGSSELLSVKEGNGWRPEKGADRVDALKGSLLRAPGLPTLLQVHLKRFSYDWQTDRMSKLNNRFEFPKVRCLPGRSSS